MVLNSALFGKSPFKNVIVNGLVLAEDGRKMSKSLKNYPDPSYILDKYGADALRYYMLSSQIVKAEPLNFSEKGVDEVLKKVINRLMNVVSFYELYVKSEESQKIFEAYKNDKNKKPLLKNELDTWIVSRLGEVLKKTTEALDKYELDVSARPIAEFIDDLSTWYLRRSRDRFKGENFEDSESAKETTNYVLINLAKIMAPFMPFTAEEIYQNISGFKMKNPDYSVHFEKWPNNIYFDQKIIQEMEIARKIVALGLEARDRNKIKVRQPLKELLVKDDSISNLSEGILETIKDELNVKEIKFDSQIKEEVFLNTEITPELLEEGVAREIIRTIQSLRKKSNLNPEDQIDLVVQTEDQGEKLIKKFAEQIKKPTNVVNFDFAENDGDKISVEGYNFNIVIK